MNLSERIGIFKKLVDIPSYIVLGPLSDGRIAYFANESGSYSIWTINLKSKAKQQLTTKPLHGAAEIAEPREKASKVFFALDVAKGAELSQLFWVDANRPGMDEVLLAEMQPMRILGLASNEEKTVGFVGSTKNDISIYLAGEGTCESVARLDGLAGVSDANEKYLVGSGYLRNPKSAKSEELFFLDLSTRNLRIFTPREGAINKSPKLNGSKVLFESNYEDGKTNRLELHDIESGTTSRPKLTSSDYDLFSPTSSGPYGWLDRNKETIWTVAQKNGETRAFGDGKEIPTPRGFILGAAWMQSTLYYNHSTLVKPWRILSTEMNSGATEELVQNKTPEEIEKKLGSVRFEKIRSFDGLEIPTFVIESPLGLKPGPTILYIHGGPTAEVANFWSTLIAAYMVAGYHIVAPNYRGSTGYGEEFKLLNIGDIGGNDLKDMIQAARWAKETGLSNQIAICGYSYGGYSTLLALGVQPDMWKCGVAGASIADWKEQYDLSDAAFKKIIEMMFDAKTDGELLKERSPITYVENVRAPLCIIHSQNDTRTPLAPVLKYALKLPKNVSFEMHVKPDLGHALSSIEDVMNVVLPGIEFLEKHFSDEAQRAR
jgi:dipeptidyl aminopeptidase/acylaminoacyl peptidase